MRSFGAVLVVLAFGCGGGEQAAAPAPRAAPPQGQIPMADMDLREPNVAIVHGQSIAFDGEVEGLVWPALEKALGKPPRETQTVTVAVPRDVPVLQVLRVAWTLRRGDVQVLTSDREQRPHVVLFRGKPGASKSGCHLALFAQPDGKVRLAGPNGSHVLGDTALAVSEVLAQAERCPLRYLAFGAESRQSSWASVFDLAAAVEAARPSSDVRYVLGEPLPGPASP